MTSVSLVVWKMEPSNSNFSRRFTALESAPLCASASAPLMWLTTMGCAFSRGFMPIVP